MPLARLGVIGGLPCAFECRANLSRRSRGQLASFGEAAFVRFGVGFVFAIARPFQQVMSGVRLGGEDDGGSLADNIVGAQGFAVLGFARKGFRWAVVG